ncbi:hypothetical protein GGR53DRAFT_101989 [Hypoxylon sp. FL1150]|nr:hypothetical protein GGR53DRAFT_101989 [Hypoxylon sp. FL1150]
MRLTHGTIACSAIPTTPVTIVVASYNAEGQLESRVFSGDNKRQYTCPDAPEEGVFIQFRDRALQIAVPSCDQRMCNSICGCDKSYHASRVSTIQAKLGWHFKKPCPDCFMDWMQLFPAAEAANQLRMKFLKHPRTLTASKADGLQTFYFDGELEESIFRSRQNGCQSRSNRAARKAKRCSQMQFDRMTDAWNQFVAAGCYKPDRVIPLSDSEDESANVPSPRTRKNSGIDSEWDDLSIPPKSRPQSRQSKNSDGYDSISDLISAGEFTRLQEYIAMRAAQASNDDIPGEDGDDDPAPVVIPPKNMKVGQGLRLSIDSPRMPSVMRSGRGSPASFVTDMSGADSRVSLTTNKRSHGNFVESSEPQPAENSPRMTKYQKREFSRPSNAAAGASNNSRQHYRRQGSVHRPILPFSRKLVFV